MSTIFIVLFNTEILQGSDNLICNLTFQMLFSQCWPIGQNYIWPTDWFLLWQLDVCNTWDTLFLCNVFIGHSVSVNKLDINRSVWNKKGSVHNPERLLLCWFQLEGLTKLKGNDIRNKYVACDYPDMLCRVSRGNAE